MEIEENIVKRSTLGETSMDCTLQFFPVHQGFWRKDLKITAHSMTKQSRPAKII
jgi:hypothetical protein